jgi:hypothetical protein
MAENFRQIAKRVQYGDTLNKYESTLRGIVTKLESIKTSVEAMKVVVDTDPDFTVDDQAKAQQASNLVNNDNYTDFIAYIHSVLP